MIGDTLLSNRGTTLTNTELRVDITCGYGAVYVFQMFDKWSINTRCALEL